MPPLRRAALPLLVCVAACHRFDARESSPPEAPSATTMEAAPPDAPAPDASPEGDSPIAAAEVADAAPPAEPASIGPFTVPFLGERAAYVVGPAHRSGPARLLANLHGICNPPGYACGYWASAASERGLLVCPIGNARCGAEGFHAPTWSEPIERVDGDLEASVAAATRALGVEVARDGAVLTGFSLGGYLAVRLAKLHPGRWPYLVVVEANVEVTAASLRASGVRALALVAGELGSQLAGERKTASRLAAAGFPAKLWVMPKAGHYYSANIDAIMGEALDFVVTAGAPAREDGPR